MQRQKIYVDESLHERAGFILTSVVCTHAPVDHLVDAALNKADLVPGKDEFKSSTLMNGKPHLQDLRQQLMQVLHTARCKVAIVVSGIHERREIAVQLGNLLSAMVTRNRFEGRTLDVYLDQGIATPAAAKSIFAGPEFGHARLLTGQDSRTVKGLQLADLCAHTAATVLLADLGYVRKLIPAGDGSGFDPDQLLELEYTLWAQMRYCLASSEVAYPCDSREPTAFAEFDAFGLFVSDQCASNIKGAALKRFEAVYLGCIH